MKQSSIFEGGRRLQMNESIELTIQSLQAHGADHDHWGIAWSGGKDSSATLTLACWLIDTGKVRRPASLTVFYADTRMELPPLAIAALQIMDDLRDIVIVPPKQSLGALTRTVPFTPNTTKHKQQRMQARPLVFAALCKAGKPMTDEEIATACALDLRQVCNVLSRTHDVEKFKTGQHKKLAYALKGAAA